MPRIKLKLPHGFPEEAPFTLEEAKTRINFKSGIFYVDGYKLKSYDDLIQLVDKKKYRKQDILEVVVLLLSAGG